MQLPHNELLAVNRLSSVFNDTTNSYKFYWFLALTDCVLEGKKEISIEEVCSKIIVKTWFPLNFYKLSFGRLDKTYDWISDLQKKYSIREIADKKEVIELLKTNSQDPFLKKILAHLSFYVPYRFIRPFFSDKISGLKDYLVNQKIQNLAQENFDIVSQTSPYKFSDDGKNIVFHDVWFLYWQKNAAILEAFCKFHLILFLQKNNPNTPNIADKLDAEIERDLKNGKLFWRNYAEKKDVMRCIYSGEIIHSKNISIDHFLPFSFVAHDQIWNLLPTIKSVNSSKGNKLPDLNVYLNDFLTMQFDAFRVNIEKKQHKILEDFGLIFKSDLQEIYEGNFESFAQKMRENILPLVQIAVNMGFQNTWKYGKP